MSRKVSIKQPAPPQEEIPTEILAEAIISISEGIARLRSGRLSDKALILLIQHNIKKPKVTAKQVRAVMDAIEGLKAAYLKKVST